ncbi:MAG: hypothetical protein BroJett013_25280 [Alphaproteobacteria bacterium]|nr:MAG: hypothetical protein BroJett013_25280 [Alphaproteobacteria bacterium]
MQGFVRRSVFFAAFAALLAATACAQSSHEPSAVATSEGVSAYLGVVPSAVVRGEHPDQVLHPSMPAGDAHLVVALYDALSGARIESAAVEAVIQGERHRAQRTIRLEPMRVNGAASFGGFVSLARNDRYHVDVLVRLPSDEREIRLEFLFDAQSLPAARPSLT